MLEIIYNILFFSIKTLNNFQPTTDYISIYYNNFAWKIVCHRCQHENLVELLGFSSDGDDLCLVYVYMPNGSLLDRLSCLVSYLFIRLFGFLFICWSINTHFVTGLFKPNSLSYFSCSMKIIQLICQQLGCHFIRW